MLAITKRSITDCLRCITTQITAEIQYTVNKTSLRAFAR